MPGRHVEIEWNGRPLQAFVPDAIAHLQPDITGATIRSTERAAAAVSGMARLVTSTGLEPIARILLRSEGVASSFIEGLRADVVQVAVAELDDEVGGTAGWVADNLAAVEDALHGRPVLNAQSLKAWHTRLMRHSNLDPALIGRWRDRQGWIGGPNPTVAAYVPPPAAAVPALIKDLLAFVRRTDVDPITQAAVAHAQFETIHPFADGNGRIGRILVGWVLTRRLAVPVPPPLSVMIARDVGGYLSGLTLYRQDAIDSWVSWFADTVVRSATTTGDLVADISGLRAVWATRLSGIRADAAAHRLLDHLPAQPVLNATVAAGLLDVTTQAARTALASLAERGILRDLDIATSRPGRPHHWWVAHEVLGLLG